MLLENLIREIEDAELPNRDLWLRAGKAVSVEGETFEMKLDGESWIDAALMLLPAGICPAVGQNCHHFYWHAFARIVRDGEPITVAEGHSNHHGGLAALAMALRAHMS